MTCDVPELVADRCHFGDAGYNILDSPGQVNLDFGLFKNFPITENVRLQFRWELFNAANTPYFNAPTGIGFSSPDVLVPDSTRQGEIRGIRTPMRIQQFALKTLLLDVSKPLTSGPAFGPARFVFEARFKTLM